MRDSPPCGDRLAAGAAIFLPSHSEPSNALTRGQTNVLLQRLQTTQPVTTLLITHSISEVICADRVLVILDLPGAVLNDIRVPIERPRRLAVRKPTEFTAIGRRPHFERDGRLDRVNARHLLADIAWPVAERRHRPGL